MSCSSCSTCVALPVPTIAGRPSSRLTMAACEVRPPWSVTNGGGALHDRHPVRVRGRRHEHRAVDEAADIACAVDQADTAAATAASPMLKPLASTRPFVRRDRT